MNHHDTSEKMNRVGRSRRWLYAALGASLFSIGAVLVPGCAGSGSAPPDDETPGGETPDAGHDADSGSTDAPLADHSVDGDAGHDANDADVASDGDADDADDADAADADAADADADDADAADADDADAQCVPACKCNVEVCNGLDDNCNGQVDENDPGGGGGCNTGLQGICAAGVQHCCTKSLTQGGVACTLGTVACVATNKATTEVCNGLDDDCDGVVDNVKNQPGVNGAPGSPCQTALPGLCATGTYVCANGTLDCQPNRTPNQYPEVCNGQDDDCDGIVDDNPTDPQLGTSCQVVLSDGSTLAYPKDSPCEAGRYVCQGQLVCQQLVWPVNESCNNIDDDCDGVVDGTVSNPHSLDGLACNPIPNGPGTLGPCGEPGTGSTRCQNGSSICQPTVTPASEICDGADNDCDGVADNGSGTTLCLPALTSNQSSVSSMTCNNGTCAISQCAANRFDLDKTFADGCECAGSVLGSSLQSPTPVSVTYGSPGQSGALATVSGILPTTGSNAQAWVKVSFNGVPAITPPGGIVRLAVTLSAKHPDGSDASGEFVMDAYDSANNAAACPLPPAAAKGEVPTSLLGWDFVRRHDPNADGSYGCDLTNPFGYICEELAPVPPSMSFKIRRANSAQPATCDTFTLTIVNQNQ